MCLESNSGTDDVGACVDVSVPVFVSPVKTVTVEWSGGAGYEKLSGSTFASTTISLLCPWLSALHRTRPPAGGAITLAAGLSALLNNSNGRPLIGVTLSVSRSMRQP